MAELKRHTDVPKERVLEGPTHTRADTPCLILKRSPDSEDNHHNCH
jgi:hypothetical protein